MGEFVGERAPRPVSGLGYQPVGIDHYGAAIEGAGSGGVSYIKLAAYARQNTVDRPFGVVNDYIANALGRASGVPVPPGELVKLGRTTWGFVTLGFGEDGRRPPPADLEALATEHPWESTGVVVFDQWILNTDRHDENVAYLDKMGIAVFDHDCALLGFNPPDPAVALASERASRVRGHQLAASLRTAKYLESWVNRIKSVMPLEIRRAVGTCVDAGLLSKSLGDQLNEFILFRQASIQSYIDDSKEDFRQVTEWVMFDGEVLNGQ